MILTREQAIAEHRKMWRWIAEEIEQAKEILVVGLLKQKYLKMHGFGILVNDCFLCEYTVDSGCDMCPLDSNIEDDCLGGLYYKVCLAKTWQEQAALARQIAELPEREDV